MSSMAEVIDRLDRIEKLLSQIIGKELTPHNEGMSSNASMLISMARHNPEAAIEEAIRLSKQDTADRRAAKKRSKLKAIPGGKS